MVEEAIRNRRNFDLKDLVQITDFIFVPTSFIRGVRKDYREDSLRDRVEGYVIGFTGEVVRLAFYYNDVIKPTYNAMVN